MLKALHTSVLMLYDVRIYIYSHITNHPPNNVIKACASWSKLFSVSGHKDVRFIVHCLFANLVNFVTFVEQDHKQECNGIMVV